MKQGGAVQSGFTAGDLAADLNLRPLLALQGAGVDAARCTKLALVINWGAKLVWQRLWSVFRQSWACHTAMHEQYTSQLVR